MRKTVAVTVISVLLAACGGAQQAADTTVSPPVGSAAATALDTSTVQDDVILYRENGELVVRPGVGNGGASRPREDQATTGAGGAAATVPAGQETTGGAGTGDSGVGAVDTAQMRTEAEGITDLVVSTIACCGMPEALPMDERLAQIEDGESLRPLLQRADEMFVDPSGVKFKAVVERVVFPSPATRTAYCQNAVKADVCALVEARIANTAGQVSQRVWTLYVIKDGSNWLMTQRSMCSLLYKLTLRCANSTGNELLDWLSD